MNNYFKLLANCQWQYDCTFRGEEILPPIVSASRLMLCEASYVVWDNVGKPGHCWFSVSV